MSKSQDRKVTDQKNSCNWTQLNRLHPFPHCAYFSSFSAFSPAFLLCSFLSDSRSRVLPDLSRNIVSAFLDASERAMWHDECYKIKQHFLIHNNYQWIFIKPSRGLLRFSFLRISSCSFLKMSTDTSPAAPPDSIRGACKEEQWNSQHKDPNCIFNPKEEEKLCIFHVRSTKKFIYFMNAVAYLIHKGGVFL